MVKYAKIYQDHYPLEVSICVRIRTFWVFSHSSAPPPQMFITVLWGREGSCHYVTSEKTWRLRKVVSWPRSHSLIKDGTGTYSSTISSLSFSETEGGDQFDLSSLDVRTMFLFLKEYFKLFNSDLPLRQVLYSAANELWPPVNQIYLSLFNPLYLWFWKLSQ